MPFKPGQSGNPAGRKVGSLSKQGQLRAQMMETMMEAMPKVIESMIREAKAGNVQAATVLFKHCFPPVKPQMQPVAIEIDVNDDLSAIGQSIIDSTSRGEISPDVSSQLMNTLTGQAKLIEQTDLAERLKALEEGKTK